MSHTASSSSPLPLGLRGPSDVATSLGIRVSTAGARLLLLMERDLSAATAGSVRLSLPLTKRLCTFSLFTTKAH